MNLWRSSLRASLLGGLAAGGAAAAFTYFVMEPTIKLALVIEESRGAAEHSHAGEVHETELVTRGLQQVGGMWAVIVSALLLSLVYAVALSRFRRTWDLGEQSSALLVALGCFTVFALAPGLKYPANPPAVGDPNTIGERTTLYFGAIVLTALIVTALVTGAHAARRWAWSSPRTCWTLAGIAAVGVVLVFAGLPSSPDTVPADVPAGLVWRFRIQSLGMLALLWSTLGLVAGTLLARASVAPHAFPRGQRVTTRR